MLRFRVPGRGRQRPRNGLPVQAGGCCPVSPRRYRSACHASQARSIRAGVELASARCGRTCRSPGARAGRAARRRKARRPGSTAAAGRKPRPASPGQVFGVAGDAVQHGGDPGQAAGHVSGLGPIIAGLVRVLGDGRNTPERGRGLNSATTRPGSSTCVPQRAGRCRPYAPVENAVENTRPEYARQARFIRRTSPGLKNLNDHAGPPGLPYPRRDRRVPRVGEDPYSRWRWR